MKKSNLVIAVFMALFFSFMPYYGVNAKENYEGYNQIIDYYIEERNEELKNIELLKGTESYMVCYHQIYDQYSWILDFPETIYEVFTEDEIKNIALVVEAEAGGANFMSKVNVASVIFNRYEDSTDIFPEDLLDIINEKNQFAKSGGEIEDSTILAIEYAYSIGDTTGGALWFNKEACNSWASRNREYLFTDDVGHEFYR